MSTDNKSEKKFKKGEKIYLEGDQLQSFYVLQSGKVSVYIERAGQKVEVDQPIIGHVVGEQGVFGFPRQTFNAEALSEVKVLEMPIDPIKTVFEKSPAPYKLFVKALGDEIRRLRGIVRTMKLEQDSMPCPPRFIPRLCAILTMVAKVNGKSPKPDPSIPAYKLEDEKKKNPQFQDTDSILSFHTLKIYTARMFLESPNRMQSFCELLSKLGYVHLKYEKNADTELMELQEIRVHDVASIEGFGEFYQHNFFKAGKSEVIIVDKTALQIAGAFCEMAKGQLLDRNGAVTLNYKNTLAEIKNRFNIEVKEVHFSLLEKKGLYVKRQTIGADVGISFDYIEWTSTYKYWQIIQEIDRWNEVGQVNMTENLNEKKALAPEKCAGCGSLIKSDSKFCSECGQKLAAA
jgi:hypothetical protein